MAFESNLVGQAFNNITDAALFEILEQPYSKLFN